MGYCSMTAPIQAQTISVVPNPTAPSIFAWSGGGAVSGYTGTPIELNGSLVLEYNPTGTSDLTQVKLQLAVYKGGDSLHLVPNPDNGQGVYFNSVQIVFQSKLFFIYLDVSGVQRLASFDGASIKLYPNPDASTTGYLGSPRILNNELYLAYQNVAGVTQIGKFTGSGISLTPNPDNSSRGFFNDYSLVFNNQICSRYVTAAGPKVLATFDGTKWTLWPNPDNTSRGVYPDFPVAYKNKLYFYYYSATNQYQYLEWDGIHNPKLVANPQNSSVNNGGVSGYSFVFNDTLFFQYYDVNNVARLGKFDGSTTSLVPNPDATTYGYWNTPIVYTNQLYIFYLPLDGTHHLTQYDGATNSLKLVPNPDKGLGYWDQPIVYDNKLFFTYYNVNSVLQPGYFDGSSIHLVGLPSGIYNGVAGNNGYLGSPVIWNTKLYLQLGSVPYGNAGNLGILDGTTLAVQRLSFTAEKQGTTALLEWKVASEQNNAYYSVEHSKDGINYLPIGKVQGHGTVTTLQQYQYVDQSPKPVLNFYRLKEVDVNSQFTYSKVVVVNFGLVNGVFGVFPNPAVSRVQLQLPISAVKSVVELFDINGKRLRAKEINANTATDVLDVQGLAPGIYPLLLTQGNQKTWTRVVKE